MAKVMKKQFRCGEDELAILSVLSATDDFKNESDVFRHALVMLYGNMLKPRYELSEKRHVMTLDEFVAQELYIAKKKYARDAKQSK